MTSESRKNNKTESNKIYTVKGLFREPKQKSSKPQFTFEDIAKHAAKKAQRRDLRRVAKLFRDNKSSYKIEKVREYKYTKFDTTRSEYKIYGDHACTVVQAVV